MGNNPNLPEQPSKAFDYQPYAEILTATERDASRGQGAPRWKPYRDAGLGRATFSPDLCDIGYLHRAVARIGCFLNTGKPRCGGGGSMQSRVWQLLDFPDDWGTFRSCNLAATRLRIVCCAWASPAPMQEVQAGLASAVPDAKRNRRQIGICPSFGKRGLAHLRKTRTGRLRTSGTTPPCVSPDRPIGPGATCSLR